MNVNDCTLNKWNERILIQSLWKKCYISFGVVITGAIIFLNWQSILSVMIGGSIALCNFRFLERAICSALLIHLRPKKNLLRKILIKYYLRFGCNALVLWFLVRQNVVEPLGLIIGLSIVVLTIIVWGIIQAKQFNSL